MRYSSRSPRWTCRCSSATATATPLIVPRYSYLLAGLLPDARLTIYPDWVHGFLFQHHTRFPPTCATSCRSPTDADHRRRRDTAASHQPSLTGPGRGSSPTRRGEYSASSGAATRQHRVRVAGMRSVPAASDHRRQMFGRTSLPPAALTQRSSLLPAAARSAWRAWSCGPTSGSSPRSLEPRLAFAKAGG